MKIIKTTLAVIGASALIGMTAGIAEHSGLLDKGYMSAARSCINSAAQTVSCRLSELAQGTALSTEKHGYGQGVIVDDKNRPTGAVDFNAQYGEYGAYALKDTDDKVIYLTFDQGYENGYTASILDTLREKNVKATFFVVGDYAKRNEQLVRRMIDEGHTVGNHSMSHYSMPDLSESDCKEDITSLHDYVCEHYSYEMSLLRPPMGEYSEASLKFTQDCGYESVLWSYAYLDWDVNNQPDPATAKEKLIGAAHSGAIYLLHSVSSTNAQVLGEVIDELTKQGYRFEAL